MRILVDNVLVNKILVENSVTSVQMVSITSRSANVNTFYYPYLSYTLDYIIYYFKFFIKQLASVMKSDREMRYVTKKLDNVYATAVLEIFRAINVTMDTTDFPHAPVIIYKKKRC